MINSNISIDEEFKSKLEDYSKSEEFNDLKNNAQKEKRKIALIHFFIALVLSIVVFLSICFACKWENMGYFISIGAIFVIVFIVCAIGVSIYKNKVKRPVMKKITDLVINEILGNDVKLDDKYYSLDFLKSLQSFRVSTIKQEDGIFGTYKGVPYFSGDVYSYHTEYTGKSSRTVVDFNGTIFTIRFNKPTDAIINIIEGKTKKPGYFSSGSKLKNMEFIETESIEFNEQFGVFANDQEKALYVLTPQFINEVLDFKKIIKGKVSIIIDKYAIAIICEGKTTSITKCFKGKLDIKDLMNLGKNLTLIKEVIESFDLTNTYWQNVKEMNEFDCNKLVKGVSKNKKKDHKEDDGFFSYLIDL